MYLGMTPLHYSAQNGHVAVVKHLVDHGADVNICSYGEYRVYQSKTLCVYISICYLLVYLHKHLYTYKIYLNEDMIASTEIS